MGRNCSKCGDLTCTCAILAGNGVDVVGTGASETPWLVSAKPDPAGPIIVGPDGISLDPCLLVGADVPSGSLVVAGAAPNCLNTLEVGASGTVLTSDGTNVSFEANPGNIDNLAVKAVRTTTQSIPHATETVVNWDGEGYDYGSFHSNVTNNSRLVIPEDGIYLLNAFAQFAATVTASAIRFRVGGTTTLAFCYVPGSVTTFGDVSGSYVGQFTAGQYVEVLLFQSNAGTAARNLTQATSFFSATQLR